MTSLNSREMLRPVCAFLVLLLFVTPAFSQVPSESTRTLDLRERVFVFSAIAKDGLNRLKPALDSKKSVKLARALDTGAFAPELLYEYVSDHFAKNHDEEHLKQVSDWFLSPLGVKLVQAEAQVSAEKSDGTAISPERLGLLHTLDAVQRIEGSEVNWLTIITESPPTIPIIQQPSNVKADLMKDAVDNATMSTLEYEYNNFSDEELSQIIAFFQSDAGKWYVQRFHEAFAEAIARAKDMYDEKKFSSRSEYLVGTGGSVGNRWTTGAGSWAYSLFRDDYNHEAIVSVDLFNDQTAYGGQKLLAPILMNYRWYVGPRLYRGIYFTGGLGEAIPFGRDHGTGSLAWGGGVGVVFSNRFSFEFRYIGRRRQQVTNGINTLTTNNSFTGVTADISLF